MVGEDLPADLLAFLIRRMEIFYPEKIEGDFRISNEETHSIGIL